VLVVRRKVEPSIKKEVDTEQLIKLVSKEHKFSANQLELMRCQPEILFQKQLFQYRYTLDDNDRQISP
jgi:hypothetical protein